MRMKLRREDAQEIAEIHDALGEAYRALHKAVFVDHRQRVGVSTPTAHSIIKMQDKIRDAMFSLENPFLHASGLKIETPFSAVHPNVWTKWLENRSKS